MADLHTSAEASSSKAPYHHFEKQNYWSIECPGPVSHPSAIFNHISQEEINECFNGPTSDTKRTLEMSFKRDEGRGVPILGHRAVCQKLLVKVTRRRRKKRSKESDPESAEGVFMTEVLGPITQTVRFRSMADWQYTPNTDGPVSQLVQSLKELDYESILGYAFPEMDETYVELADASDPDRSLGDYPFKSTMDLQPTPVVSDRRLPPFFNFRNPNALLVEDVEDELTGEVRTRFVNRQRFQGFSIPRISHMHEPGDIPKEPIPKVKAKIMELDPNIMAKLRQLFTDRPLWLRHALLMQFSEGDRRTIVATKVYLPSVAYTFGAGPFWKCLIKLGYDPCVKPEARIYQRIYFYLDVNRQRNMVLNDPSPEPGEDGEEGNKKSSWVAAQERLVAEGKRLPVDTTQGHIFDGQTLHRDKPDYQLCDITDPLISKFINDEANTTEVYDHRNGWYTAPAMDLIKDLTRLKYVHLREEGEPIPLEKCLPFMEEFERAKLATTGDAAEEDVQME